MKIHKNSANHAAGFLLEEHSDGGFRDEYDFLNTKFHCQSTLNFTKDIILNFDNTNEEKVAFIDEILKELDKFYTKK
jgi:hypothetical protein